jgi:DNA-binding CsgD family transcriptional regulator
VESAVPSNSASALTPAVSDPAVDPAREYAVATADPAREQPTDTQPPSLTSKYTRLTLTEKARILLLREEGLTQPEIAKEIGCSQSSVNYTLATYKQKEDVVNLLLIGKLEDRLANWDEAEKVASKRGDHRPTKERLEMAMPKLRPQPAAQNYGGVTVVVAMPGGLENPRPVINVSAVCQAPGLSPAVSDDLHRLTADNKAVDVA